MCVATLVTVVSDTTMFVYVWLWLLLVCGNNILMWAMGVQGMRTTLWCCKIEIEICVSCDRNHYVLGMESFHHGNLIIMSWEWDHYVMNKKIIMSWEWDHNVSEQDHDIIAILLIYYGNLLIMSSEWDHYIMQIGSLCHGNKIMSWVQDHYLMDMSNVPMDYYIVRTRSSRHGTVIITP